MRSLTLAAVAIASASPAWTADVALEFAVKHGDLSQTHGVCAVTVEAEQDMGGKAPVYTATIFANGTITFQGFANARVQGFAFGTATAREIRDLFDLVDAAQVDRMDDQYLGPPDAAIFFLKVERKDTAKIICDGGGTGPASLDGIRLKIDAICASAKLVPYPAGTTADAHSQLPSPPPSPSPTAPP